MAGIHFAGLSDRGRLRANNEDSWFARLEQKSSKICGLFLVADGIGGHVGGKWASKLVAENLPQFLYQRMTGLETLSPLEITHYFKMALRDFSHNFWQQSQKTPNLSGMGTTVVVVLINNNQALVGHLGDSRVYLFRQQKLTLLTQDHTLIQYLIETKVICPEEAQNHPARNRITRFVGMEGEALPDVCRVQLQDRDRLLLCSDGLTTMLLEEQIVRLLATHPTQEKACQSLVEAANRAGGRDNITVLILDWYN